MLLLRGRGYTMREEIRRNNNGGADEDEIFVEFHEERKNASRKSWVCTGCASLKLRCYRRSGRVIFKGDHFLGIFV
jgi:hypothetical protein